MPACTVSREVYGTARRGSSVGTTDRPFGEADTRGVKMGSQENAELVRRGYAAFSAGDMATLNELFAEDAVWHVPGRNTLSGPKKGRGDILAFFGELMTRTAGALSVTVQDVIGGQDHTIGLHHNHAERDNKVNDQDAVLVFTIRDGRVTEVQEFHADTASSDEFWD